MKRIGSLVLAACLLLGCMGCDGGEQEEIYSSALGEPATEAAVDVGEERDEESSSSEEEQTAFFADPNDPLSTIWNPGLPRRSCSPWRKTQSLAAR